MAAGKFYSRDEDQIIREHYVKSPRDDLLRLLPGRAWNGIIQRASILGVKRAHEFKGAMKPFDGPALGHLTEAEKGYLAGIIDGEGTIMFCRRRNSRKGHVAYAVQVSITNTSPTLAAWLDKRFPDRIYRTNRPSELSKKPGYVWTLSGTQQSLRFLREIEPYLVIKREQARAVMDGYVHLNSAERDALQLRIKAMKRAA